MEEEEEDDSIWAAILTSAIKQKTKAILYMPEKNTFILR